MVVYFGNEVTIIDTKNSLVVFGLYTYFFTIYIITFQRILHDINVSNAYMRSVYKRTLFFTMKIHFIINVKIRKLFLFLSNLVFVYNLINCNLFKSHVQNANIIIIHCGVQFLNGMD